MSDSAFITKSLGAVLLTAIVVVGGCSRTRYRVAADREVYSTIAERNGDPRWSTASYNIEMDRRSRYHDVYSLDQPPIPVDDPSSARYMQCVDGKRGWKHWYDDGVRGSLENPQWQQQLGEYASFDEDGAVRLDIDSSLQLAYLHSPNHQSQLETLYLSSLDVTRERFNLDTQFFGGYDIGYDHRGNIEPARIAYNPGLGRYEIIPPTLRPESNVLSIGSDGARRTFQANRQLVTAGTLLAGFANGFVFEFTGPNQGLTASLLNFAFLQPLLRGAGRDIALENLTQTERTLLANLRSYAQFRQGFYTQVVVGELGVVGPQRFGRGTSLDIFSGQAILGGYIGLLRQLQVIRNAEDNLDLQVRTRAQLEALLTAGLIDLVQVDQFRQNVKSDQARLLELRNDFLRSLDQFKLFTLGLPPSLQISLDDELIRQFQLVDRNATGIQDKIAALLEQPKIISENPTPEAIEKLRADAFELVEPLKTNLESVANDLTDTKALIPLRMQKMNEEDQDTLTEDFELLDRAYEELVVLLEAIEDEVDRIQRNLPPVTNAETETIEGDDLIQPQVDPDQQKIDRLVVLLRKMLRLVQGSVLVQARSRLEAVTIQEIDLSPEEAFEIALQNRLDFMNARAALVDDWRQIQIASDALQSVLDLSADGTIETDRNNPLSFRGATSRASIGLQFDAPLTRLLERNAFRESLINYQRSRRNLIQSRDRLQLDLRNLLRDIEQLRRNLEIQRSAVSIAIRRVDVTGSALYAPVPPPQPGQRSAPFGPTAAINLLSAQSALRDTQNSFLTAWLSYYAAKLRLARELGVMQLDLDGRLIDEVLPGEETDEAMDELEITAPISGEEFSGEELSVSGEELPIPLEELPPPIDPQIMEAVEEIEAGMIDAGTER